MPQWTHDLLTELLAREVEGPALSRSSVCIAHGEKIHSVWDNRNVDYDGKDQRRTRFNEAHGGKFELHDTPRPVSWVNQSPHLNA